MPARDKCSRPISLSSRSDVGDRVIVHDTIHGVRPTPVPLYRGPWFPRNSRYDDGAPLETGRVHTYVHRCTRVASTSFQSICDDTPMGRHSYRSGTQTRTRDTVISSPLGYPSHRLSRRYRNIWLPISTTISARSYLDSMAGLSVTLGGIN